MITFVYYGDEFRDLIIEGYESTSGHKIENIDYFMVDSAIRYFAIILISLKDGTESLSIRESAVEMMRSSLPPLTKLHDLVEVVTGLRIKEIDDLIENRS